MALPKSETRRSLVWCSFEGMSASVVGACSGGAVLTAWADALGASPLILGILWALPYLAQLSQPWAAWLTSLVGPKRLALAATTLSRQALWVVACLPLCHSPDRARLALVACFAAIAVAGVVGNNAWTAWVAAIVPARIRGRYFGPRNARAALVGTVASIGVGALLDRAAAGGWELRVLAWTSAAGAVAGLASSALLREQHDPFVGKVAVPRSAASPRAVFAAFGDPRLGVFLAFQALWGASTGFAGCLYSMHALTALGLGVMGLAIANTTLAASRVLAMPVWGRTLDRAGPRRVLVLCTLLSGIGSALWIATCPGRVWPVALDAVVSGVALGGVELSVFALPLALGDRENTPRVIAGAGLVAGLAYGGASILGGFVVNEASGPHLAGATRAVFALSATGRVLCSLIAARIVVRSGDRHAA